MVDVILISWNYKDYTLRCLRSIFQMTFQDIHVTLVDNASTDGAVEAVRASFPQVEIQVSPRNLGFGGAANAGLELALKRGSKYILLVCNDTELAEDMLERLLAAAEVNPRAGILSPLIYYPGRERIWYASGYRRRFWPTLRMEGFGVRDHPRFHRLREVDYVTGCILLFRAETLRQIGLFDPVYLPIYHEDLDLCERARRAGWRLLVVPDAVVEHQESASYGRFSRTKWYFLGRHIVPFYQRYYRWPRLALTLHAAWVVARETVRGHAHVCPPFVRGIGDGWRQVFRGEEVSHSAADVTAGDHPAVFG